MWRSSFCLAGRAVFLALSVAIFSAGSVHADPCKAIPDVGSVPPYLRAGAAFEGPVVYVGDGDSLCIEIGAGPSDWVEVRLADFYAPELSSPGGAEAKRRLEQVAMGRRMSCVAGRQSYDRVVARCTVDGRLLGDLLREHGGAEGGRGRSTWSPDVGAAIPPARDLPSLGGDGWLLAAALVCAGGAIVALRAALKSMRRPAATPRAGGHPGPRLSRQGPWRPRSGRASRPRR